MVMCWELTHMGKYLATWPLETRSNIDMKHVLWVEVNCISFKKINSILSFNSPQFVSLTVDQPWPLPAVALVCFSSLSVPLLPESIAGQRSGKTSVKLNFIVSSIHETISSPSAWNQFSEILSLIYKLPLEPGMSFIYHYKNWKS